MRIDINIEDKHIVAAAIEAVTTICLASPHEISVVGANGHSASMLADPEGYAQGPEEMSAHIIAFFDAIIGNVGAGLTITLK